MSAACANSTQGLFQKVSKFVRCQWGCASAGLSLRGSTISTWRCRNFMSKAGGFVGQNSCLFGGRFGGVSSAGLTVCNGQLNQRRYRRKQPRVYKKKLSFDYSGDLTKIPPLDPKEYLYKYRNLPEVQNAPEAVKKLTSLEFADGASRKQHRKYEILQHINTHLDGDMDKEQLIARWTVEIRNQIAHCLVYRGDKRGKVNLIEKIAARKKQLKFLRKMDFERFHWLLHELKIRYTPFPLYYKHLTKRYRRKQRVRRKARAIWDDKMAEFKKSVDAEKVVFYEKKEKVLAEIQRDLRELNIDENKVFSDFNRTISPPIPHGPNKNLQRILRNYENAVASGKFVPKPTMSPIR